ncbi:BrnT family toxin [Sphingomonas gilva]|uniref:BrnT family toxin n=1 Tax=Sphingomonas gilva TaxID=2305907 RepID=A0A396RMD1_9SPHN|nr:BrnT family toxin [Sphingomonas gilva]RHW16806.1 BrnT family toxin [Sphingomonas gilva]
MFEGRSLTIEDGRFDYGERRMLTFGWLDDRAVAMVWTEREGGCRVISMRHMHRWEIEHVGLD